VTERQDEVWKNPELVRAFLEGVRGGVPYAADQLTVMLRVLAAREKPLENILDVGCGSGVLARTVVSQFPNAAVTLLDFSEPMLTAARDAWANHTPAPRFAAADLASADWINQVRDRAPFDAIVSGYAIHHLSDPRKYELFTEIFSLLASGGAFVNVEHVASATPQIEALSDQLMIDSLHAFHTRQGTGESREQVAHDFLNRPDKAANILAPVETQCEWLRRCGFVDVDCYFKIFELAVFGGRKS
jgi:ubiquinone/menaquinone biosynthesis C-methylase UbiE